LAEFVSSLYVFVGIFGYVHIGIRFCNDDPTDLHKLQIKIRRSSTMENLNLQIHLHNNR